MDPNLTQAINAAARRMTDAAPGPELRARVLSQIAARRVWTPWRLAIAGGALGAATLAVTVSWPQPAEPIAPVAADVVASTTPAAIAAADDTANVVYVAPAIYVDVVQAVWSGGRTIVPPSANELDWQSRRVAALDTPDPLRVDALQPPPLSIDTIDITPLSVAPLTVPAMGGGR